MFMIVNIDKKNTIVLDRFIQIWRFCASLNIIMKIGGWMMVFNATQIEFDQKIPPTRFFCFDLENIFDLMGGSCKFVDLEARLF